MYRDEQIAPDIVVPLTRADLCSATDAELDTALETLRRKLSKT
jgi:hypothetical protein